MKLISKFAWRFAAHPLLRYPIAMGRLIYGTFLWRLVASRGKKDLRKAGTISFWRASPLRIQNLSSTELVSPIQYAGCQINPTIHCIPDGLRIYWRLTTIQETPFVDFAGRRKSVPLSMKFLEDHTCTGTLAVKNGKVFGEIKDASIIPELSLDATSREELAKLLEIETPWDDPFTSKYHFEDPRVLPSAPNFLTLTAVQLKRSRGQVITNATMAIYNLDTKRVSVLRPPNSQRREKNWPPIKSDKYRVTFLRSAEPHTLSTFDRRSGELVGEEIHPLTGKKFLHGGTPFVLVDNEFYVRVARFRMSMYGRKNFHISQIVVHDLDFAEIRRSRPFVFRDFGVEICNGMDYDGTFFYFSWGENDTKMFVGTVEKGEFLGWLNSHIEPSN